MDTQRRGWLVWILAGLLLAYAADAHATGEYRTVEIEALKITIDSEWAMRTAPGYLPVRFDITNLGEAREIEITAQGMRFFRMRGGGQGTYTIVRRVRLVRGDRIRLTIPVPLVADNENFRFEIHEDGRELESFNYVGFQSKAVPDQAAALIVVEPGSDFAAKANGWPRTVAGAPPAGPTAILHSTMTTTTHGTSVVTTSRPSVPAPQPLDFVLPPARLPDNWLGYTSLRAVVLGPKEWEALTESQKTALLTWTACGGDLLFVDGSLAALLPGGGPPAAGDAVRAYYFGRIHLPTSASLESGGLHAALTKASSLQDANWALPANRASDWGIIGARGFRLPIPGVQGVPARAYLGILLVFSILIGPVNYWVMWRLRHQVLLVVTAPLLSILFIVLLAGYVVAGEGVGVRGRAVTFTMLDQARKGAATRASASLYAAGMAPRGGLRFAHDEAVFPLADGAGARETQLLDLTEAQRLATGAIQARSPANLEFIGFRAARERLTVEREPGGVAVVNALGATVAQLIYRDGNTTYRLAAPLQPGGRALLRAGAPRGADVVPSGMPLSLRLEHLFDHPPDGAYLAVLERSPFWNAGVANVDERGSFHVVIGWIGGQP